MSPFFVSVSQNPSDPHAERKTVRYDHFVRLLLKADTIKMEALHIALGLTGEAAEFADAIKKEYVYNKPRDMAHIQEELGDIEFYLQCAYNHYGLTRSAVIQENALKLEKRYAGLAYSDEAAQARADKAPGT